MEIIGLGPASIFDFMTFGGQVLHYKLLKGKDNGRKRSSQKKKWGEMTDEGFWLAIIWMAKKWKVDGVSLRRVKGYWCFYLLAARIAILGWMPKFYTAWVTKLLADGFFEGSDFVWLRNGKMVQA